jgi:hypothetical protein
MRGRTLRFASGVQSTGFCVFSSFTCMFVIPVSISGTRHILCKVTTVTTCLQEYNNNIMMTIRLRHTDQSQAAIWAILDPL